MDREIKAFDALAKHSRLDALAAIVGEEAHGCATAHSYAAWPDAIGKRVAALGMSEADGKTEFGDLRAVLERGPENEPEATLVRALSAHALAMNPPTTGEAQTHAAAEHLWLSAHTPFAALSLIDRALDEELADGFWSAIASRVRRVDSGTVPRAEALVGAVALASSSTPIARKLSGRLRRDVNDAWVKLALGRDDSAVLDGELGVTPRSVVTTTLLAVTGLLFVAASARAFARMALALRRPTTVRIASSGIEIDTRTEMLGRTLRERRIRIEKTALARAAREVRYPRLAFYSGLLALAIGSYLGVALLLDGTRAASPSLLVLGLVVVMAGIAIDFFFSGLSPGLRGKCRLVFVPRKGAPIAIDGLEAHMTDRALEMLRAS